MNYRGRPNVKLPGWVQEMMSPAAAWQHGVKVLVWEKETMLHAEDLKISNSGTCV